MKAWVYGSLDTILRDAHITSFTVDTEQPGNYYVTTEIEVLPAAEYEAMEAVVEAAGKVEAVCYEGIPANFIKDLASTAQELRVALTRLRALGKG